ncbi:cell division protein DedD [Sodalis sp. RH22]|uniref:cell division protein DedD n=1 Tax=unclassified Sodalis (in: enterobacteria) TaxID=2636512 RepID=UPI0039B385CF
MASKFQNRLVGTIIIVALGVIVLPGLLDGKKKHYQDEFAAIPLVPKPGDSDEADASPQANQALPSQPPEGAGAAVEQASQAPDADDSDTPDAPQPAAPPVKAAPKAPPRETVKAAPAKPTTAARQEPVKPTARPEQAKPVAAPAPRMEPAKPAAKPEARTEIAEAKPVAPRTEAAPEAKPVAAPKPVEKETPEQAPQGQAWVVQLGALKNATKVTEIVGKLRLSGYRVYTVPSTPVAGQITRIFVGPDASKQKLQSSLPEMNQLSGLSGQLRAYQPR